MPSYPGGPRSPLKVAKPRVNESESILTLGRLPLTVLVICEECAFVQCECVGGNVESTL